MSAAQQQRDRQHRARGDAETKKTALNPCVSAGSTPYRHAARSTYGASRPSRGIPAERATICWVYSAARCQPAVPGARRWSGNRDRDERYSRSDSERSSPTAASIVAVAGAAWPRTKPADRGEETCYPGRAWAKAVRRGATQRARCAQSCQRKESDPVSDALKPSTCCRYSVTKKSKSPKVAAMISRVRRPWIGAGWRRSATGPVDPHDDVRSRRT